MRAQAILFDKDGTLFDFHRTWSPWAGLVIEKLAAGDAALASELAQAWHYDEAARRIGAQSIIVAGGVRDVARAVEPILPGRTLDQLVDLLDGFAAETEGVEVVPLAAFLDGLKARGLKLGVATNDSEDVARVQLARSCAESRFDFIAGYDSGYGAKPDPGMCRAFVRHVGIAAEQIVMVGDSVHDLSAGRAAGMQTVAVLTGVAGADELASHADAVLPDIGGLPRWLG